MTTDDTGVPPVTGGTRRSTGRELVELMNWWIQKLANDEPFAEDGLDLPYRRAFLIAKTAHAGQTDKTGADYFGAHVLPVTARAVTLAPYHLAEQAAIVALLHDVVEDTSVTLDDIEREFDADTRLDVDAVTHRSFGLHRNQTPKWESYLALIARSVARPVSTIVKLADNRINHEGLHRIPDRATRERLDHKYSKAYKTLWPAYVRQFGQQPPVVELQWENPETGDRR